ncbi:fasciclin-like arabinogalactan protein 14 [Cynara cardunculus var. scolymus]|uniref:fasciclin-like arabinogalactan protein 14 n=1 Tax=Cynara cardunculus var. scolymus TaxID=59895 RepID=UPI000D62CCFD|nr:fasciclin-like arabinogalactan protein 14 [Cynara cardunculus var. scolymus]
MHFKVYLLLYTHLFVISCSDAFNITTILSQHPSFSTFNHYISQTQLTAEINSRRIITVFAVPNDVVSSLSGKPHDVLKNLLRVHVVLGYYDVEKLRNLPNGTVQMTTLFQITGRAVEQQGFLKATVLKTGNVVIRSATQTWGAILLKSVAVEPCHISVVSISTVIVPMGMDCGVLVSDSNSTSPVEPPAPHSAARSPKMPLVPAPGPSNSPKMVPPWASTPKAVPSMAPKPLASHEGSPSPSANAPGESSLAGAPTAAASESLANAPGASRESPPKRIDTPTGSPPAPLARLPPTPSDSGGSKTSDDRGHTSDDGGKTVGSSGSNLRIVLCVVTTHVILSSIHFIVNA